MDLRFNNKTSESQGAMNDGSDVMGAGKFFALKSFELL
jgi:hypothetical protein